MSKKNKHDHHKGKKTEKKKLSFYELLSKFTKEQINRNSIKKLLFATICFILIGSITYYRDKIIKISFDSKPRIIANITKVEPINLNSIQQLDNVYLLCSTYSKNGLIAVVKIGDFNINKLYSTSYIPIQLIKSFSKKNYSISFKNIGGEVAKNVSIDLDSYRNIQILKADPKIKLINCGTTPVVKTCHLEITTLSPGEEISFFTLNDEFEKEQFKLRIDGKTERVSLNHYAYKISPYSSSTIMMLDGKKIIFPPINNTSKPRFYYYWQKNGTWNEFVASNDDKI